LELRALVNEIEKCSEVSFKSFVFEKGTFCFTYHCIRASLIEQLCFYRIGWASIRQALTLHFPVGFSNRYSITAYKILHKMLLSLI